MTDKQKQKVREEFREKFTSKTSGTYIGGGEYKNMTWLTNGTPLEVENYLIKKLEEQERELVERIESKDFYDLMQVYRHTPLVEQELVVMAFENVKKFITKT